jgi:DNA polymerase III subunit gamma/tau
MSQQVLARKFRPHKFEDLVGQEHIVAALNNSLKNKRLHHAYLFTGTRGVGKTTLARIIAKAMSCEKDITPTPCETCSNCKQINSGCFIDLFEIDAASHTKVDETKEIITRAMYPPSQGRFRIFIIDEVHMLSKHSFNALLKTLEEPPEYVKFILATTNPEKLPDTILSRCLQFNLSAISPNTITAHLANVLKSENIEFEQDALELIAENANGSMRDALSITEPVITFANGKLTKEVTAKVLGIIPQDEISKLLLAITTSDADSTMQIIKKITKQTTDIKEIINQMLKTLHSISIAQVVPKTAESLGKELQQIIQTTSPTQIQLYYQIALKGVQDLAYCPSEIQCFEMICIRQLAFKLENEGKPIKFNIKTNSTPIENTTTKAATTNQVKPAIATIEKTKTSAHTNTTTTPEINTHSRADAEKPEQITTSSWAQIITKINVTGMTLALLKNTAFHSFNDSLIKLELSKNQSALFNDSHKKRIEAALTNYFQQTIKLEVSIIDSAQNTPIKQEIKVKEDKKQQAKSDMLNDANVQTIMTKFDAKLNDVTID